MTYLKSYKVPTWVIIEDGPKAKAVAAFFEKQGGLNQVYPSGTFVNKIESLKNRGYHHIWENPDRVILPPDFLMRAASEHMKDCVTSTSLLAFNNALLARIERQIKSPEDYPKLMDAVLYLQPDINLSQSFQIKERCFRETGVNYTVFYSVSPANKNVLQRVAETVITVGEGDGSDINIKEVESKNIKKFLEKFTEQKKH